MVFFVCEACNESLKKNKVETHSYTCRNCWVLTCVDCNKQFNGDTYAAHNSCISEAQRYEGKLYDGRTNKGDVKQALWISRVQSCAAEPTVQAHLRPYVERLLSHDNIPRKKAKFENFAKNSLRLHDAKTLGALWSIFEKAAAPVAAAPAAEAEGRAQAEAPLVQADVEREAAGALAATAVGPPMGGAASTPLAAEERSEKKRRKKRAEEEGETGAPGKRVKGEEGERSSKPKKEKRDKAEKKQKKEKKRSKELKAA